MTLVPGAHRIPPDTPVGFQEPGLGQAAGAPGDLGGQTLPAIFGLGIFQPEVDTSDTS